MLVERRILQGEGKAISIVSTYPQECLVPEPSALHSLVQSERAQRRIEEEIQLSHLADELVVTGVGHVNGVRVRSDESHLAGQQLRSAVAMLENGSESSGSKVIGKRTVAALNRVMANKKVSGGAVLAAKRAHFELSLNRVNTYTKLAQLGAQTSHPDLFMEAVPLLFRATEGDEIPHRLFDHNPKLLANAFSMIEKLGDGRGDGQRVSQDLLRASMLSERAHLRIVAVAAAVQSSYGESSQRRIDPNSRRNYPGAVTLLMDHVANSIDTARISENVRVSIEQARQLVIKTAVLPPRLHV